VFVGMGDKQLIHPLHTISAKFSASKHTSVISPEHQQKWT